MELKERLRAIRAHKWLVILIVLGVTVSAIVVGAVQTPLYQAEAGVLLTETNAGAALIGSSLPDESNQAGFVQTQVELIGSGPVVAQAIGELGLKTTPGDLMSRVTVSRAGQTNFVTIDARDGNAERAAQIANALAYAYVAWSRDVTRASIKAAADEVQRRLAEVQQRIVSIENSATLSGGDKEARLTTARDMSATLASKLENLSIAEQLETGSGVAVPAATGGAVRVSANAVRSGALGLAVGLVCALGAVLVAEYFDNTIRSSDEVEEIYGAPVLAHISAEQFKKDEPRQLSVIAHPTSPAAESYRVLRSSLDFINSEQDIRTLVVASARAGEGKSTVAANLAAVLSLAGKNVALVMCDFRGSNAKRFFDVDETVGLSDILTTTGQVSGLQQPAGLEYLRVLAAGRMPANPSELLGSTRMQELVASLRASVDWIILDTPPLLTAADASAAIRWADGVLVVTRTSVSTREAAEEGRGQLQNVGARILGVVVWDG